MYFLKNPCVLGYRYFVSRTKRDEPNVRMPDLCFGDAHFEPQPGHSVLTEVFVSSVGLSRDRP